MMQERERNEGPRFVPSTEALVEVIANCHARGYFVRDPSPRVLAYGPFGIPRIAPKSLEKRASQAGVPHLSLAQLWSLMHGASTRRKIEAGRRYAERRGIDVDLDRALRFYTDHEIQRCLHDNRDFKIHQAGGLVWHVRRDLLRDAHEVILEDPDRFLRPGAKLIKDSRRTTIAQTPGDTLLKRYNLKKYRNLLKHHFAPSRARRAFQTAYHFETLGIPTPLPIAFAERRVVGTVIRSYLLTEYIPDGMQIDRAFRFFASEQPGLKDAALDAVGRLVGLLHDAGFANRDLKASNILVTPTARALIIDLDGIRRSDRVNDETRIKNLRRMTRDIHSYGNLPIRDRMRFLRSYTKTVGMRSAVDLFRILDQEPWS